MPSYVVEFKKKNANGFNHSRKVVEGQVAVTDFYNYSLADGIDGLEFFTVRLVKTKPEVKKQEIKK
jgi:hypothetical protein